MARTHLRRTGRRSRSAPGGVLLAASLLLITGSPRLSAGEPASRPTFEHDIRPLLQKYCWQCHGAGARRAGLDLRTLPGALKGGDGGEPAVVAGKPDASPLFHLVSTGKMPPKGKPRPTAAELVAIRRWVESGADLHTQPSPAEELARKVYFLLEVKCQQCHGRKERQAGLDLRTRGSMLKGGKSGPALVPGDPAASRIIRAIAADQMPPRNLRYKLSIKPVSPGERQLLEKWIAAGAPEPPPAEFLAEDGSAPREEDRRWWAFQPPRRAVPPPVKDRARVRTPVDAFVLSKLETARLTFSPEAGRAVLARRAYLDVVGLPPTAEEIDAFQKDTRPDAYERLIDRLLASPHYGERWGQYWLDAAGYADSEGSQGADPVYPDFYRYRDYVIRAHNSDKPYDRFLLEQLAGDELDDYAHLPVLSDEAADNLVATGFLRTCIDPTVSPETNFPSDRYQVLADTVEIVSSALLGLTMRCAHCHSHKYDPISQADYYQFTAIFAAAYAPQDWLKPPDRFLPLAGTLARDEIRKHNAGVDAKLAALRQENDGLARSFQARLVADRLAKLAEPMRGEVQKALTTAAGRRSPKQKELAGPFEKRADAKELAKAFPEYGKKSAELQQAIAAAEKTRRPLPMAHGLTDVTSEGFPFFLLRRGEWDNRGPLVHPNVPAVLRSPAAPFVVTPPRAGAVTTGRRLALARWLTRPDHPLTARVLVNRVWQHHFGTGLVATADDFGHTGARPSHPELLDWLATEFVTGGWSLKKLHRLLLTSSVYRQQSTVRPNEAARDPENRLLWRMPLRRLDAEALRDSILAVSEQLNRQMYGPPVEVRVAPDGQVHTADAPRARRRSIYVLHRRSTPLTMLETFDAPRLTTNCVQRRRSTVVSQAFLLLNSPMLDAQAGHLAEVVGRAAGADTAARVDGVYRRILGRGATTGERTQAMRFLEKQAAGYREGPHGARVAAEKLAMTDFCLVLLNAAEFLYVD